MAQAELLPRRSLISEEQFCDWIADALPGERLEYHRGLLGCDRMPSAKALPEPDRLSLVALAKRALQLAEGGRVLLVQRRHGDGDYSYTAIKTRRRHRSGTKGRIGAPGRTAVQALTSALPIISRPSRAAPQPEDLAVTGQQFEVWLKQAAPGDRLVYHRGYLAVDRARGSGRLSEAARRELVAVANLALALADRGEIHLVQRRHRDGDYSYLAVLPCGRPLAAQRGTAADR